jgi:hypothetical protein
MIRNSNSKFVFQIIEGFEAGDRLIKAGTMLPLKNRASFEGDPLLQYEQMLSPPLKGEVDVGANSKVIHWNPAEERVFKCAAADALGVMLNSGQITGGERC